MKTWHPAMIRVRKNRRKRERDIILRGISRMMGDMKAKHNQRGASRQGKVRLGTMD